MAKAMHCSDMGSDCTFVARGETVDEARRRVYANVGRIGFSGSFLRKDIAWGT